MPSRSGWKRPDLAERNRAGHPHAITNPDEPDSKHCTSCCKDKPLRDFPREAASPDGCRSQCKRCCANRAQWHYHKNGGRERQKVWRKERAADFYRRIETLKDVPCADCGGRFPRVCMDFDHVLGDKVDAISSLIHKAATWEAIMAEIEKCEVVCSNCHRIRTAIRGQFYGYGRPESLDAI